MHQTDSVCAGEGLLPQRSMWMAFRPDIEGLRAIAVLAVVLYHAELPGVGGGYVGVDVFFVISGFLITGLLLREVSSTGSVRLRRFYGARIRRLLPASAAVGVVTLIGSAALLPLGQARSVFGDGIASALYVGNYWFFVEDVDYFNAAGHLPPSPFQHYWSLGVEEQFYLLWPAMIIGTAWFVRRRRKRGRFQGAASQTPYLVVLALVAAVSFALSFVVTFVMPAAAFFSLPTRAWQLAAGGLVALTAAWWCRLPAGAVALAGWTGMALILLACTQLSTDTPYPGTAALWPTLGAVLVIGAGCAAPAQGCGRMLGLAPMQAIGRISYSWYLWHWPVLVFAPLLLGHQLGLAARLAAAGVSAGLAVLTLRFLENPVRFAAPLRRSPFGSLALGAATTAVPVVVGAVLLAAAPTPIGPGAPAAALTLTAAPASAAHDVDPPAAALRHAFSQVQSAVAASVELAAVPSNLEPSLADAAGEKRAMAFNGCVRNFFEGGQPECAMGDTASPTRVVLLGDSHAAMLIPAFEQIASQRPWRLEIMAKAGCPAVEVPISNLFRRLAENLQRCKQWRDEVMARLHSEQPRLIVVSLWRHYGAGNWTPGFTSYDPAWTDGMTRLVQQLRGTGAKVLVLGPVPDPQSEVPICLSSHLNDAMACAPPRSTAVNEAGIADEAAATEAGGGEYIDLTDLFCTAERCAVIVGNTLVYLDWNHLTVEYSRLLAPVIGTLADRALARG